MTAATVSPETGVPQDVSPVRAFTAVVPAAQPPVLGAVVSRLAPGPVHVSVASPTGCDWVGLLCQPAFAGRCDHSPSATLRATNDPVDCPRCLEAL